MMSRFSGQCIETLDADEYGTVISATSEKTALYWVDTTIVPHTSASRKVDSYTAIRFDITARKLLEDALRTSKEHLDRIASLDPLTELPNRRRFQEHLEALVSSHAAHHLA